MSGFAQLLARNRNYRFAWMGQIVSEVCDHFNNIAVLSLAVEETHSGAVIAGLMLSRAIPAVLVGPLAGVLLDRFDRKQAGAFRAWLWTITRNKIRDFARSLQNSPEAAGGSSSS